MKSIYTLALLLVSIALLAQNSDKIETDLLLNSQQLLSERTFSNTLQTDDGYLKYTAVLDGQELLVVLNDYTTLEAKQIKSSSATFRKRYVYCCKDPKHDVRETDPSEAGMKEIQKKNKCATIGICFLD